MVSSTGAEIVSITNYIIVDPSLDAPDVTQSVAGPYGAWHTTSNMYRWRRHEKLYQRQKRKPGGCQFCDPAEIDYRLQEQSEHAVVVPNKTPYDVWEHHRVLDNLMVIPKRHVTHLGELTDDELLDIMRLVAQYEEAGYNVYARTNKSPRRSQGHQHTNLIKIDNKPPRLSMVVTKPYLLVRF
jgi:diadenosine tetraphosphate (Ap4A) HIT family hydrolase